MRLALALTLLFAASAWGTPWPERERNEYIERCVRTAINDLQFPPAGPRAYCQCLASEMSAKFGIEGHQRLMKAKPDPDGSYDDYLLYRIFTYCWPPPKR